MDSCCVGLTANTHVAKATKQGLKAEKRDKKVKPGVAYAVITSNNPKETLSLPTPMFERRRADPKNVAAIILGGGAGTQLFPLTKTTATPAVPVGGCYRLIDIPMSNCINSANSLSEQVLAATQTPGETGKNWFQGTADAVRQFTWVFEDARNRNIENILILSGDHLYRMDYMDFLQSHIDRNADITISCAAVGQSRAPDYGLVKIDDRGRVVHFAEKPRGADLKAMVIIKQISCFELPVFVIIKA
ncbi:hypothetical protein Pint_34708 [Pistacia integerrima]|uniref:Uncharacterized protein n=1 Tax=Pistacia integerrima TaxID=434235 RepID=A0ACC0X388_9ROSI|nr:hypothetical protein Pint_34708 [Pistacia integerrima]